MTSSVPVMICLMELYEKTIKETDEGIMIYHFHKLSYFLKLYQNTKQR